MTKDQEIELLKEEIKQLKFALLTVFTECSENTPIFLSKRINVMKKQFIKTGVNIDQVIAGEA